MAVLLALLPLAASALEQVSLRFGAMGTDVLIEAYGPDREALDRAAAAARAEIDRVEALMTDWRPSPLTRLNEAAGAGPQVVDRELAAIIARGVALHGLTDGTFDISFAGVGKLWAFKPGRERRPDEEALARALAMVDASRVQVDEATHAVTLPAGMRLGLGGIAKGYGVDRAISVLREAGVEHAMVNAGGDLRVIGRHRGTGPWEVAVKHPRDRDRAIAALKLAGGSLVTSGDYERFFEHEGKRYHHILDPRTGRPATGCMSATVLARRAELADALATALCVLGPEKGLAMIEGLPGVEAVCVDLAGTVHVSRGLETTVPVE